MVAQFLIQRIELLAGGGVDGAGQAELAGVPAGAHFHRGRLEAGVMAHDDLHHRLGEARLLQPEYLQRELAGVFEQAVA